MPYNGDIGGISSEDCDVLLQPVEGRDLVHESVVGRGAEICISVRVQKPCKRIILLNIKHMNYLLNDGNLAFRITIWQLVY